MVFAPGYLNPVTKHTPLPFLADGAAGAAVPRGVAAMDAEKSSFTPMIVVGDPEHARANAVLFGDNERVMRALAARGLARTVDLVYIDPPFNTGRAFMTRGGALGYSDRWSSEEAFLAFLHARLSALKLLLSKRGSFYLHIDHAISHLVRIQIDDAIGRKHWRNEITRTKGNPKNSVRKAYGCSTDVVHFYSYPDAIWNDLRESFSAGEIEKRYPRIDEGTGRRYDTQPLYGDGVVKNGATGQPWRDMPPPPGKHWARPPAELEELDRQGRIYWSKNGVPRRKIYADESPGKLIQDVWNFKDKGGSHDNYPTEKNVDLLDRIVLQSSAPGSIVLDCFMGSGTTLVAAARHGRRFVGIDQSRTSLAATIGRLTCETDAAFTVLAPDQIVDSGRQHSFHVEGSGDEIRLRTPRRFDNNDRVCAVLAGSRRADGAWQTVPLRRDGEAFVGMVGDSEPTHVMTVQEGGDIVAAPLRAATAKRRSSRGAAPSVCLRAVGVAA